MNKSYSLLIIFLASVIIIFSPERVSAQPGTIKKLTLDECIRIARTISPAAKMAVKTYEIGHWSYMAFRAGLKPQVRINADAPGFNRSITPNFADDGTQQFVETNQAYSRLGLSIAQPITVTGGTIALNSSLNRVDYLGGSLPTQYSSRPVSLTYSQPLFSYNAWKWSRKVQPIRYKLTERRYLEALEEIATQATQQFFGLFISRMQLENANFNLSVNDSIYIISRGRYNLGKIAENELLQSELAYLTSRQQVKQLELDVSLAEQNLVITLGFEPGTLIEIIPPDEVPFLELDPEYAWREAQENRSDMLDYQARLLEAESNLAQARSENRFNMSLDATFGLNQNGENIRDAYYRPLDAQYFTLGIDVPIIQWGKGRDNVAAASAMSEQTHIQVDLDRQGLERDVKNNVAQFMLLQQQLVLAAKSDTIAERRYEVAKSRYLIGKVDITVLQMAQNDKNTARSSYMSTLREFWVGYYRLRRITLYDFIQGKQIVLPPPSWSH